MFIVLFTLPQKLTEQRLPVFNHEIVPDYLRTKPDPEVEEQEKQLSAEAARIGVEVAQVSSLLALLSLFTGLAVFPSNNVSVCEQKQIQALNKLCSSLLEKLNNPREERDAESMCTLCLALRPIFSMQTEMFVFHAVFFFPALRQNKQYFNPADTNMLVGAVAFGKGLSKCRPAGPVAPGHPGPGNMMGGGSALQQGAIGGGSVQQAGSVVPQQQGQQGRNHADEQGSPPPQRSAVPLSGIFSLSSPPAVFRPLSAGKD